MRGVLTQPFGLFLALVPHAAAQVTGHYESKYDFAYEVTGMPDFDQVRAAIFDHPGCSNDGRLHCGPTAVMNVLGFIGSHGWSHIPPGDSNWEDYTTGDGFWTQIDQERYDHVTVLIESLALDFMGMDPWSGTGADELQAGTIHWLKFHDETWLDQFDVSTVGLNGDEWTESGTEVPTPDEIAYLGVDGALMVMRYGRYDWEWDGGLVRLLGRTGGHLVAIQLLEDNYPGNARIVYRNSSTGGGESPITQSVFGVTDRRAVPVFITNGGLAGFRRHAIMAAGVSIHDLDPDETQLSLIDDVMVVHPKYGFTLTPDGNMLDIKLPGFTEGASYSSKVVTPPAGGPIVHARLSPDGRYYAVHSAGEIGGLGPGISMVDRATGEAIRADDSLEPRSIVFGRQNELYAADYDAAAGAARIRCYERQPVPPFDQGNRWVVVGDSSLAAADIAAMAYDDHHDELLVFLAGSHDVHVFPRRLDGAPTVGALPASLVLVGGYSVEPDPEEDIFWINCPGTGTMSKGKKDFYEGWIELYGDTGHGIEGFSIDDKGDIFASVGGVVKQFREDGAGGLEEVATSLFVGQPCGAHFQVSRSRTNVHPDLYDQPGSHDLNADEVEGDPACRGDFNGDGVRNIFDFLSFQTAFGNTDLAADLGPPFGVLNVFDFLAFQTAFGEGCE